MNAFLEKLENTLSPLGTKLGNQQHLKGITSEMMLALPFEVSHKDSIFVAFFNEN